MEPSPVLGSINTALPISLTAAFGERAEALVLELTRFDGHLILA
jgi:hypothetical protein